MARSLYARLPHWLQMTASRVLGLVPARWRQRRITRQVKAFLAKTEGWSVEQWRDYQDRKVRELVAMAYGSVPYYREVWKAKGIHPSDVDGAAALSILPFIDNRILKDHFDEFESRGVDRRQTITMTTGGTMGAPTRFRMHRRVGQDGEVGYIQTMWRRVGFRPGDRRVILRGAIVPGLARGKPYYYDRLQNSYIFSNFGLTDENQQRLVELIRRYKPLYLHTYPSAATVLCQYLRRKGITDLPPFKAVLASSENMYPGQRELITETLGARVYTWYGHAEHSILAGECEHSSDYHAFPSYGVTELIDAAGERVTDPGGEGELVGTGFNNPVMPLIRYRTGDRAAYVGPRCEKCGRNYPLINRARGHYWQEMIVGADGELISVTAVNVHDDTFLNIRQRQFHQVERGALILRIVKGPDYTDDDERKILDALRPRLGSLKLTIEYVDKIPMTSRGKWKYLIQELKEGLVSRQPHEE